MSKDIRKTIGHTGIYTFGNIVRNMVSFIMLPIYTRYLTPEDYGTLELLSMIIDFAGILVGLRIGEAIFRFYAQYDDARDKKRVISTAMYLVGILNAIGVVCILLFSKPLSTLIFGSEAYVGYIVPFTFTLLFQAFNEIPLMYIRAQQRPWLFVTISILKLSLQLGLNIYFVVFRSMHVEGVIISALLSGGLMGMFLMVYTFSHVGVGFAKDISKKLVSFSFPLMMASILSFYLTFGDRYFLRVFSSLTEVGIYSLGYKFGFLLLYFTWHPFANIWDVQKYEIFRKPDAKIVYQRLFFLISCVMIFFSLGVSVYIKDILTIMSDPSFHRAYQIVPIILLAYLIQGWTSFCNLGILIKGKTLDITYATLFSVVVITIGYTALIPLFGSHGAAWATLIGTSARFFWVYFKANRHYDMELRWAKVLYTLGLAACTFLVSLYGPHGVVPSIAFHTLLLLIFIGLFYALPIIDVQDKQMIVQLVKNPKSLISYR